MRIAISGPQNTGKSTLVKDFLTVWPMYQTPGVTYRDILKKEKLPHSKETSRQTQLTILKYMTSLQKNFKPEDNVIFDRCPIDCLVYTLWAYENNLGDFDDVFVSFVIKEVRESLRNLDIVFYVSADDPNIAVVADGTRETNLQYRLEIDNLFKSLLEQYSLGSKTFFPENDTPAFIEIRGNRQNRLIEIGQYVTENGTPFDSDPSSIFKPDDIDKLNSIIRDQKEQKANHN